MKFRFSALLAACAVLSLLGIQSVQAQGMEFFQGTWEEAKAAAQKENKSIFLDAYASWCGPCKNMAKYVFTNEKVGEFYNDKFINVKMDMEKGEGISLSDAFEVTAYPTFLYFNPDGDLVHKSLGQKPVDAFIVDAENALDESTQLITLQNRYVSGNREADLLRNYALALHKSGAIPKVVEKVSAEYIGGLSKEDMQGEDALSFLMQTVQSPKSYPAQLLLNNLDRITELFGKDKVQMKFKRLAAQGTAQAAKQRDEMALSDAKDFAKRALGSDFKGFDLELDMLYYEFSKDWTNYAAAAKNLLAVKPANELSWSELNTVAWNYYLHVNDPDDLQSAIGWAKQSVKMDANSYNLDTYAALMYKTGKYKKALKFANKAIAAAKADGLSASATEKLVMQINKARKK